MKKVVFGIGLMMSILQAHAQLGTAPVGVQAQPNVGNLAVPNVGTSAAPNMQAMPMGAPAMVVPAPVANVPVPAMPQMGGSTMGSPDLGQTLKIINERRAQIELLKLEAELIKAREPLMEMMQKQQESKKSGAEDEAKKNELAKIKAEADAAAVKAVSGAVVGAVGTVTAAVMEPSISVLSIYGLENNLMATVKVDDMVLNVKKGDKLPAGYMVKEINFENVDIVKEVRSGKKKKELKQESLYVSGSDAAAIYAARGKSGTVASNAGTAKPAEQGRPSGVAQPANSLPPLPVSAR